jgi:3-oxoacyl-[acyl-carrier protein] reductase
MTRLGGKSAIVTGASRAIGRAIAERLAREGAAVVVNYTRNENEAQEVVATINAFEGRAVAVRADVSRPAEVARLWDAAEDRFGSVAILVNNAAIYSQTPLAEISEEEYETVFGVNVRGVLFGLREAARRLADSGRIVNISSDLSVHPDIERAVYGASKAAVDHLTQVAARELGRRGITVNSVLPGPTVPGMFARAPEPVQKAAAARSPMGRLGTPRDIADVVAFLASADARWVTGQIILATGGG